jgi:hypothetical protein
LIMLIVLAMNQMAMQEKKPDVQNPTVFAFAKSPK